MTPFSVEIVSPANQAIRIHEAQPVPSPSLANVRGQIRIEFGVPDNFELDINVIVPLVDDGTVRNIKEIGVCLRQTINGITAILVSKHESGSWESTCELATHLTRQQVQAVLRNAQNSLNWSV